MARGNHDHQLSGPIDGLHLYYADLELFFAHSPDSEAVPADLDGWIVHCHVHDNAPFFNPKKPENKRVCRSNRISPCFVYLAISSRKNGK